MYRRILELGIAALVLAYGGIGVIAQDRMPQADSQQSGTSHSMTGCTSAMGVPAMRLFFIAMDTDGDGTISLPEFMAAHERIFKGMDTNKDGKLTPEEMQAFRQ